MVLTDILWYMEFPEKIIVTDQEIDLSRLTREQKDYYIGLARKISDIYRSSKQKRIVVSLSGPSGSGKSVIAELLKTIFDSSDKDIIFYPLDLDAFHFSNAELEQKGLRGVKGRYDTYNVELLEDKLQRFLNGENVTFPIYSRGAHEPIENGFTVSNDQAILFLVGLWIQNDSNEWKEIRDQIRYTFSIFGPVDHMRQNTIQRHIRGGRNEKDAQQFFENSDAVNTQEILSNSVKADEEIQYFEDIGP